MMEVKKNKSNQTVPRGPGLAQHAGQTKSRACATRTSNSKMGLISLVVVDWFIPSLT
jgi:hypothetical protein